MNTITRDEFIALIRSKQKPKKDPLEMHAALIIGAAKLEKQLEELQSLMEKHERMTDRG